MNAKIIVKTSLGTKPVIISDITGHSIDDGGHLAIDVKSGRAYFAAGKWCECWIGEARPEPEQARQNYVK